MSDCLLQLTGKVEAAVPVAFGRGVGWRGGAGRVALLEGRWRGRCGRGGGGRVAAGVQLVQHWRVFLVGDGHVVLYNNHSILLLNTFDWT